MPCLQVHRSPKALVTRVDATRILRIRITRQYVQTALPHQGVMRDASAGKQETPSRQQSRVQVTEVGQVDRIH